jgi:sugar-specific transcriptional regulator TrmB
VSLLSHEVLLKTLVSLGLKEVDAEVYLLLAKEGSQKGRNIAEALKLYKQQLYRSLNRLQRKNIVSATLERPARFSAISRERIMELLIEVKVEQAQTLQASREELLSSWRKMIKKNSTDS